MTPRPGYRQAAFRGVPFLWETVGLQGGRSTAIHQYPLRDDIDLEDTGGEPKEFGIQAFLLGDDYLTQRDAFEAALDQVGPGRLVHPTRGEMDVQILTWRAEETITRLRSIRYEINVVRPGKTPQPAAAVDTPAATVAAATVASAQTAADFSINYGTPSLSATADVQAALGDAFGALTSVLGVSAMSTATIGSLLYTPNAIALQFQALIASIINLGDLQRLFGYSPPVSGAAAAPTVAVIAGLLTTSAIVQAGAITASTNFSSYDAAINTRDALGDAIDTASATASDALYQALQDLRVAVAIDLGTRAADLARITTYTPLATLPALVIAQRLYGSDDVVDRADEICLRNQIQHPGFVPGGQPLEVLSE